MKNMNRRNFLKMIGLTAVAPSLLKTPFPGSLPLWKRQWEQAHQMTVDKALTHYVETIIRYGLTPPDVGGWFNYDERVYYDKEKSS